MADNIKIKVSADTTQAVNSFGKLGSSLIVANQGLQILSSTAENLSKPFRAVVSEGRKFTSQMSKIKAVSKLTADEFDNVIEKSKEIGRTTQFTAVQAGQGLEALLKAGQSTSLAMDSLADVMNLASATGLELGDAADLVAIQLGIFKKEGLSATEIVDGLAKTTNASAQNIFNLREALRNSSGTAAAFGISFNEMTVILGAMADAGVRGERAGTALNGALSRLANPTAEVKKVLNDLGIAIEDVNPLTNEFGDILDRLSKSTAPQLLQLLGQEAGPKFAALVQQGSEALTIFSENQNKANTASQSTSEVLNNLEGDILELNSAVSGLSLTIFVSLNPGLRSIISNATEAATSINNFLTKNNNLNEFEKQKVLLDGMNDSFVSFVRALSSEFLSDFGKKTTEISDGLEGVDDALKQLLGTAASTEGQEFLQAWPELALGPKEFKKNLELANDEINVSIKKTEDLTDEESQRIKKAEELAEVHKIILKNLTEQEEKTKKSLELEKQKAKSSKASGASTGSAAEGVAASVAGEITGGREVLQGFMSGDPLTGIIMAVTKLTLATDAMQAAFGGVNDALAEIFEPIGEAIAPIIEPFADIIIELKPVMELLGRVISLFLTQTRVIMKFWAGLAREMSNIFVNFGNLIDAEFERFSKSIDNIFSGFIDGLKSFFGDSGGGSKKRQFLGVDIGTFHSGTTSPLGGNDLLNLPGMRSDEGLALLQEGEQVVPSNGDTSNISGNTSGFNVTFNVKSINPREQSLEIREMLEEMVLTGRLNLSAA